MRTGLLLGMVLWCVGVLAQTTLPRYQQFQSSQHDDKKHCLYENKLYSEGAVVRQGDVLLYCIDKDKRDKIVRLGWELVTTASSSQAPAK
ncbi:MAG: DUF1496 domain-containing protein [Pseudomonadales bacterium]|nr:DUF1496 domain-containing protein [Pseudomonadales bacterium]